MPVCLREDGSKDRYSMAPHPTFLDICSFIYVGNEARCRICMETLCWMAQVGCPLGVSCRPHIRQGELGLSSLYPRERPRRLAAPNGLPARSGSVRRVAGQHGQARTRERGGHTPKQRTWIPPSGAAGAASAPQHILTEIVGSPPALARAGVQCYDST